MSACPMDGRIKLCNFQRIYFVGFLFAGINIVGTAALSAVESVKAASAAK